MRCKSFTHINIITTSLACSKHFIKGNWCVRLGILHRFYFLEIKQFLLGRRNFCYDRVLHIVLLNLQPVFGRLLPGHGRVFDSWKYVWKNDRNDFVKEIPKIIVSKLCISEKRHFKIAIPCYSETIVHCYLSFDAIWPIQQTKSIQPFSNIIFTAYPP